MPTNVPTPQLSDAGYIAPSEQDILTGVLEDFNNAFNGNLNKDLSTPQGQLATSITAILGDFLTSALEVFNGVDPSTASGKMQDAIGRIYFMKRRQATPTTVTAQLTLLGGGNMLDKGTIIAKGSDGSLYALTEDTLFPTDNSASVTLTNTTTGAIMCPSHSLTLYQGGLGISKVDNASAGIMGRNAEGRAEFEKRRAASVASNGKSVNGAILGALKALSGVSDAYVVDNSTDEIQNIGGVTIQPKTLYIVVQGGDAADIGQVILEKKPPAIPTQGAQSITVKDTTEDYGNNAPSYVFHYDNAQHVALSIKVKLAPLTKIIPQDATRRVFDALAGYLSNDDMRPSFGDVIYSSRLASVVNNLGDWSEVLSLTIDGGASFALNINQLPTLDASGVEVDVG